MGHKNKTGLREQAYKALQAKNGFGRSKHQDKVLGIDGGFIYSFSTMKTYMKHVFYFVEWCRSDGSIRLELGRKPRTLEECEPYVERFIRHQEERGLSAYTVKMELSAISKMYGKKFDIQTVGVRRQDIKRSRGRVEYDRHFSEVNNAELVNFCRCVGPRRNELEKMNSDDLRWMDGRPYVEIKGKGGRVRLAPIVGSDDEVRAAIAYLRGLDGHNRVHHAADIHGYRSEYATRVYDLHRRPQEALRGTRIDYTALTGKRDRDGGRIWKNALYFCRNDQKGIVLDRAAMLAASEALGHNRESVVGEHYIKTNGKED